MTDSIADDKQGGPAILLKDYTHVRMRRVKNFGKALIPIL
jgi:hypothetical protein